MDAFELGIKCFWYSGIQGDGIYTTGGHPRRTGMEAGAGRNSDQHSDSDLKPISHFGQLLAPLTSHILALRPVKFIKYSRHSEPTIEYFHTLSRSISVFLCQPEVTTKSDSMIYGLNWN